MLHALKCTVSILPFVKVKKSYLAVYHTGHEGMGDWLCVAEFNSTNTFSMDS